MTTTTRTGQPATAGLDYAYVTRQHVVTGTLAQLTNLISNHHAAGTFIAATAPRPIGTDRFQVVMRLLEPAPIRPTTWVTSVGDQARTYARPARRTRIAVIATTAAGTVAGLLAAAAYLIGQLVELLATPAALILGVLAVIVAYRASRRSRNRHCPGC